MQDLVKSFVFDERMRDNLTFSDAAKIRLNPATHKLELRAQSVEVSTGKPIYPLDTDLYVQITATNPLSVSAWLGFAATPTPSLQPTGTSASYRLNNGTSSYYWSGAAWTVAGAGNWSTEADVAAHIATFPATAKKLSLLIRLVTTDKYETPTISCLDVLMRCDISYLRSLIGDSLVPALRAGITATISMGVTSAGGATFSLASLETPYVIASVTAVYAHATDSGHLINLYSSYNSTTKVVTLTGSVALGTVLWVEFIATPDVFVSWDDQDYIELKNMPAIIIDGISVGGNAVAGRADVRNINTNAAVVRRAPLRLAISMGVLLVGEGNRTLLELWNKSLEFFGSNATLRWTAVDEYITLRMIKEGSMNPRPNLKGNHQSSYTILLENVYFWVMPAETLYDVQQVHLTMKDRLLI